LRAKKAPEAARRAARRLDLCLRRVHARIQQVDQNRVVEQVRFLRDHANRVGQRFECHVTQVVPIQRNAPRRGIV